MNDELKNFFYPKSVCVVGASTKEKSIGYELLKTIKSYDYKGKVLPVNPKADEVLGYRCFRSITEVNESIDLAIIVVPKQFAEASVEELLAKDVKSIVLITAGFKEIGSEGAKMEQRILDKVKRSGARLVGPNCMGVISTLDNIKLNATFVAEQPQFGKTGFFSQSGALGAAVLNSLRETDIKFSHFISAGNKADINENDLLSFWQNDENISTLTFYLESFVNGKEFLKPFMNNEITKPVVVLKAGKTESGKKAASSHTGALSSSDDVVNALLNQYGIIRVNDLNELFNTAKAFENFPVPKGRNIAVITNAGGPAILGVDKLEEEGLTLAQFSEETKNKLRSVVHPEGSINNPVDLLPGGNAEIYSAVNKIVADDDNVDAIVSIFVEPVMVQPMRVVEAVAGVITDKPIMQVVMPLPEFWETYRKNTNMNVPIFRNPEDPAEVLSNMIFYNEKRAKLQSGQSDYLETLSTKIRNYSKGQGFIPQEEVIELVEKYQIPVVKNNYLKPEEIESAEIQFPVVLKGLNDEVIHKSELDAVKLNIKTRDELIVAAKEIKNSFAQHGYKVNEFLLQPFITGHHEILLGGFRDPSFGPVLMFGTGGKYVEVYKDTVMKSAFISRHDIDEMISATAIGKILCGVRGGKTADINSIKSIIKSASKMMLENKNIIEFDFNPLLMDTEGKFHAVDVRIRVD